MKRNYLKPAIKAAEVVVNSQILAGSKPTPDPKQDVDLPFINTIENEGYAD